MNNKFDELAKGMAQSVTRRSALKKFGGGIAGIVLTSLGLANRAQAGKCLDHQCFNDCKKGCQFYKKVDPSYYPFCVDTCYSACYRDCGV